jgi:GT2 family glycosyltransferase
MLSQQKLHAQATLEVYLVDDGSTDDTCVAVQTQFPFVNVIRGTGSLYWNGGMRVAFAEALRQGHDIYLWLNDDTILYELALAHLLGTYRKLSQDFGSYIIVVGAAQDPATGNHTYGGVVRDSQWRPLRFRKIPPANVPILCDTMNGNCVLIPREVAQLVGNLDEGFTHSMGDFDYGLRAKLLGCTIWIAPGYVGTCQCNPIEGSWGDFTLPFMARWRIFTSTKVLPFKEWKHFCQRNGGRFWFIFWLMPYVKLVFSGMLNCKKN